MWGSFVSLMKFFTVTTTALKFIFARFRASRHQHVDFSSAQRRSSKFIRASIVALSLIFIVAAYLVYASIDRTVYVTETILVIPESAESAVWNNIFASLVQDISEDSLLQNFSQQNSAYLDFTDPSNFETTEDATEPVEPVPQDGTGGEVVAPAPNVDAPVDVPVDSVTDSEVVPAEVLDEEPSVEVPSEPQPEPESQPSTEPVSRLETTYPLANDVTEVPISSESLPEDSQATVVSDEVSPEQNQVVEENVTEIQESNTETLESVTPAENTFGAEVITPPTTNMSLGTTSGSGSDTSPFDVNALLPEVGFGENTLPPCEKVNGCVSLPIEFTEFGVAEVDTVSVIENIQVRLSLAGAVAQNPVGEFNRVRIEYTFDENWVNAGVIDIDEEISNSLNGGYYLFALPQIQSLDYLAKLKVRVLFEGAPSDMKSLYLESLWLEIKAGSFYEPVVEDEFTDVIDYSRDLLMPEYLGFVDLPVDYGTAELPSFNLRYRSQENFIEQFYEAWFDKVDYQIEKVEVVDTAGQRLPIPYDVSYHDDGTWTLQIIKQPQKMRPGKFKLLVTLSEDGKFYEDAFEFYWGVLAINTQKTRYHSGEVANLSMAALTQTGDTICDAKLELKIIDPDFNIHEVPVTQSGSCGPNNVTNVADYLASFAQTTALGSYQMELSHFNKDDQLVHKIRDTFVVEEFIPYDIERTGPTRIYPPSPYTVSLKIKANRTFEGDITERLPQGFVVLDNGGGLTRSLSEYNELVWENVSLDEGEELELKYTFDAPDVSPYLYLLGPLDMDGFKELRQWQIASDALGGVAWLSGTQTTNGTDLSTIPYRMLWSTSTFDNYYFSHSTTSEAYKLTVDQSGDYLLGLTLPYSRTDGTNNNVRIGAEVRVNGTVVPAGYARSGFTDGNNGNNESSSHVNFLLNGLSSGDYIEVYVEDLTTIVAGDTALIDGQASMYLEYINPSQTVFSATTTRSVASTNLNRYASSAMQWIETRQDSGFVHSDSVNPENITVSATGTYMVFVNIPITSVTVGASAIDENLNLVGRVRLNGREVPGGIFSQGYISGPENDADADGSLHWAGVIVSTTTNQNLTITVEREANSATTTVTSGAHGSIFIQKVPDSDVIVLRGRDLSGGTDWSDTPAEQILWQTNVIKDDTTFTHSTSSNSDDIVVDENGDYLLVYNSALTSVTQRTNVEVTVTVDSVDQRGAKTKSHFIRQANNHGSSSAALTFLLEGLTAGQTINVTAEQEGNAATANDVTDAIVMVWKKAEINFQPEAITFYDTPFDSIRYSSTTPKFEFSAVDPDGTSNIAYQISWSTTTAFTASTTKISGVDTGFTNTASSSDTSPFVEGNRIRYQVQSGDELLTNNTYYWRVRAIDINGSGLYSDWSAVQSMTIVPGVDTPQWYQTADGQFDSDTLTQIQSTGAGSAEVVVPNNEEVLVVYGQTGDNNLKYRLWDNGAIDPVENNAINVGGVPQWVVAAAGIARDEYVVGVLDASNDVNFVVFNRASSTWGNLTEITTTVSNTARRGLAVTFETVSGDAMAVSCDGDADPSYRLWNGTSWYASGTINMTSANNCEVLTMASDPNSDEIILVARDTGASYEAHVWTGSAWSSNTQLLGSMQAGDETKEGLAVAYEASGNQAIVLTTNGTGNNFLWNSWDGVDWGGINATVALANDFENGKLAPDDGTDRITLCYINDNATVGAITWDGDAWLSNSNLTLTGNDDRGRTVDCEYESLSGRDGYIIAAYGDTGTDGDYHAIYNTSSWTTNLSGSNINDAFWVQTERAGDGTVLALHFDDENDDIDFTYWNGSSWSAHDTLEDTPPVTATPNYETGAMAAKRYVSESGIIRTSPINHSAVPNQPTWGDLYFSTTESVGTDVKVRVYYTSTTTCDLLIPNAALSGNSSGFDVTASPINLNALSTTTYDQICLEATLSQNAAESPTLNDWRLTWERTPFITQNDYRWYENGSFLTPTDPWSGLLENTPLNSTAPINNGDEIRLRMSLNNDNVALATSTESFKLQYAAAETCSLADTWVDVGGPTSTTTLWRGYENSIVGDDWLAATWTRRISLTVDSSLVDENLTSFPVYVNLADLPTEFFSNVQSDGDDIRITTSDGVTQVPFELVSINTGTETGELHFKGDLSSTTDAVFYIYYGNAGASGYAASATYGSRNVWTNSFSLRYALDDNPASSGTIFDSTSNSNNATAYTGMTSGDVVTGQIGSATNLDGNDGGTFGTALAYGGTFTASMWWRSNVIGGGDGDGFAIAGPTGANEKFGTWTSGNFFTRVVTSSDGAVAAPANGSWAHVVLTRDSSNKVDVYLNGTRSRLFTDLAQAGTSDWINFGGETSQGFEGDLDELRFSTAKRTNGWITTEYNNQSNPTGFYAISSEELLGDDGLRLASTTLTVSDRSQTYEQENPTRDNVKALAVGEDGEWDFVLSNNNASSSTNYCFRLIYADGEALDAYNDYPQLLTNGAPQTPVHSAPFDNEKVASSSPWFDFAATDDAGDEISYYIQVDDDYDFSSNVLNQNSVTNFTLFENVVLPSDKDPYNTSQTIRYKPTTTLTNGTTYWWRVRARDPLGSGTYSSWSTPQSFTVDTSIIATTWFQTTSEQFDTLTLEDASSNAGADDLRITTSFTAATATTNGIDFDDGDSYFGNAWGELAFTDTETSSDIKYQVEYLVSGTTWALIPDSALTGNSAGFDSSPVSLIGLDTSTYNEIRLRARMTDSGASPRLSNWSVTWGYRVSKPTLTAPFDNAKVATTTPTLTFTTTDPENDELQYQLSFSTSSSFTASSTYLSNTTGFTNNDNNLDTSPFDSGDSISYKIQPGDTMTSSTTYWWRVRAKDPLDSDTFSEWSDARSFTVDQSITTSVWYQTTGEQFDTATLSDVEGDTVAQEAQVTQTLREVMIAYGEGAVQSPRYKIWDGTTWSAEQTAESVGAQLDQVVVQAAPTRSEYALATLGTDGDVNIQIYNGPGESWGNQKQIEENIANTNYRSYDIAYESDSGGLLAVSCSGNDAVYSTWNGTSWTATSSLNLNKAATCLWAELAPDPTSDEMILLVRHTNAGANDYQALVWDGSAFLSASTSFGGMAEDVHEGLAVSYEASGGQAVVVGSNDGNASFFYNVWNGTTWAGVNTHTIGNDFEWGQLVSDVGTDNMVLCYIDENADLGVVEWNGSGWNPFREFETFGNAKQGRAVSCQFEILGARDGYIMLPYSDDTAGVGEGGRYQWTAVGSTTFSGEFDLGAIEDSYNVNSVRAADGKIIALFFEDINDDYIVTSWNGSSWTTEEIIDTNPSVTGVPFNESAGMAARIYPAFESGTMRSDTIDFDDGDGPKWDEIIFNDTIPGASDLTYQIYYKNASSTFVLIPNSVLPGNSTGLSTTSIDISDLDRTIYNELQLQANFTCDSGDCPTIQDWSVLWSEGIQVSGLAYQNDETTLLATGTVAVVVNGALQASKTGVIAGDGTWFINNVNAFPGDTISVFIDGVVPNNQEAVAVTSYDGLGDVTGMVLSREHLTMGSNDTGIVINNADLSGYDYSTNENLFYDVTSGVLNICADTGCTNNELHIKAGVTYTPNSNTYINDLDNRGTVNLGTSTMRVSGSWNNLATTSVSTSVVIFTATSTTETIVSSSTPDFFSLTLGEVSGNATWTVNALLDVNGNLAVNFGKLNRGTTSVTVAGNLTTGTGGLWRGNGTTTFDGSGASNWSDTSTASSSVGKVVIDGTSKTVNITGDVEANRILIGADDVLQGGTGNDIYIYKNFINNNAFIPNTSTLHLLATTTSIIDSNGSSFYNLNFNSRTGVWSFVEANQTVTNDFRIATGTVTLPTGTTTIGGSFTNTGSFAHNNGVVLFNATASGKTITQGGSGFLNTFYNLNFNGSGGGWTFQDTIGTTTNNFVINNGTVTLPSGQLIVGADFLTNGGGFNHNSGEVVLLVQDSDQITTRTSSLNDLTVRGGSLVSSWYNDSWLYRIPIVIEADQIDDDLSNFPIYVNLDDLPSHFFSNVKTDGSDIRVTQSNGTTEVPREVVSISTGSTNGELYFRATSISSSTDTTFYIYYGNSGASSYSATSTFGARNVWSNNYVVVNHMNDLTTASTLNSTGTINGTKTSANNPLVTTSGKTYSAQDFSGDSVQHAGNLLLNQSQYSVSMWFNPDALTGGNADQQTFGYTLYGISAAGAPYQWLRAGGTGNPTNLTLCAYDGGTVCNVSTGAGLTTGVWRHVSVNAVDGGATTLRVNGTQRLSFTNTGNGTVSANFTIGDLRPARLINFDGLIDEVRVANVTRTNAWRDAEYRNMATTTSFYSVSTNQNQPARTFGTSGMTILGDLTLASGGDSIFPSGTLNIGGSFDNNAEFTNNSGTVVFNSTAGSETIAAGASSFATLQFNSATGNFTITENATSTTAITLTSAANFTLNSGIRLTAAGTFSNAMTAASTTWTGSTLRFVSGTDYAINTKTSTGDAYGTLVVTGDTDINMWNSTSSVYTTLGTGSIYSQDHNGVDGALNIYGNYTRTSGTEHWSYATDFDGTALSGLSRRAVSVSVATSSTVRVSTSTFSAIGEAGATTTVRAISGRYSLALYRATTSLQYVSVGGTNVSGLQLLSSSTISAFTRNEFLVGAGSSGITVDNRTINRNPAGQYYYNRFTNSGGTTNVTLSGIPTSYWWFRDGMGNINGESFDNDDGNPGSVRWDDSSLVFTVSGTVYQSDGTTPLTGGTCNGVATPVRVVVRNGATYNGTCSNVNGTYSIPGVTVVGDAVITVFLNGASGGERAVSITKTPTANVTNMHLYVNRVTTRHEDVAALTIADMASYDFDNDSDIPFTAATTTNPDVLTVFANRGLQVYTGKTFAPAGTVTLLSSGSGTAADGTLYLQNNAIFTGSGTTTYTIGGSIIQNTGATFNAASSTVRMTATTSGKAITTASGASITFNQLEFVGASGGWNLNGDIVVQDDLLVSAGTLTGTEDVTINNGFFYGNGLVSLGSGTTTLVQTNTLGGTQGWTFGNLVLGNGLVVGTTTPSSNATTTILGRLTISTGHFLDAGASSWNLAGTGTVFVENGTFLEDTSSVTYSGAGATNIRATTYYDLNFNAISGSPTYTAVGLGINVLDDMIVSRTATTTVNFTTNDTALDIDGDLTINTRGTFIASNSGAFTVGGSYDNNGIFNSGGGTLTFNSSGTVTIAPGNSSFGTAIINNGSGSFTITESATSTSAFTLTAATAFTLNPSQTLAVGGTFTNSVGGAQTTWTSSRLRLYSGTNYQMNAKTVSDSYETLLIGSNTDVRMWNSNASTYTVDSTGSLYSQDHNDVAGDLYIYGNYPGNGSTDYWSYATDFDGAALGSSSRQVDVRFASGASMSMISGGLRVLGTGAATTTIDNQGSGTYGLRIGGSASTTWNYYAIEDTDISGLTFSGSPNVVSLSYGDIEVTTAGGSGITVGGTVINTNPSETFTNNIFATTSAIAAYNVTATGTTVSAWRFTNHGGNIDGEDFDNDPDGNPGYVVWDNSDANITISGNVYSDEGTTVSTVCDSLTNNIRVRVAGLTDYFTSCNGDGLGGGTGFYSVSGITYSLGNSIVVYIDDEVQNAVNVTVDPVSNITSMHLYENRVIVRHESTDPMSIDDLGVWDSVDDADILYTATNASPDTMTLPANTKLIIWNNKNFAPGGNVTISGGGGGADYDGTLELLAGATFTTANGQSHSIGGSLVSGAGATFNATQSTTTLTTTGASRTVDINNDNFYNVRFTGSGSWTITDTTFEASNDYFQSAGAVTLPSATSTIGGSFNVTGGSFSAPAGLMYFTATDSGNVVRFNGSTVRNLRFNGVGGSWTMTDTNATSTGYVIKNAGSLTLPSGIFTVRDDFINVGTLSHNNGTLRLTATTSTTLLTLGSNNLNNLTFAGASNFIMSDVSATLSGSLTILNSASVAISTSTLTIGGSLSASGGTMETASGTILFNSTDTGETINPGNNDLYNVVFSNAGGGWSILANATATRNFTITTANNFTVASATRLYVGGVFTNAVGGSATTWTGSTLSLNSGTEYEINTKTAGGDSYNRIIVGANTDISSWNSRATTTSVSASGSWYSQDHNGTDGRLNIYGDYHIATTTEYWSYATDFDGSALVGGARRAVNVYLAQNATTSVDGGTLNIIGAAGATTTIQNQGSGNYAFRVSAGTFNADYYAFRNLNSTGLSFTGSPTISSLNRGDYVLAVNGGSLIRLSTSVVNANPSLSIVGNRFATTSAITGYNVNLSGSTTNAWTFSGHSGNFDGEAFDFDGATACGSIRWSDSSCLLTQQTHYRWRNDDGGIGVPNSEWFNASWDARKRVRLINDDSSSYTDAVVKLDITYDADMQADFDDLRFTDQSGTTELDYWIERYTASTDADVWVKVPTMGASDTTDIFMYYKNAVATTTSSNENTFLAADDFEDDDISEYTGNTSLFNVGTAIKYGGTYGLDTSPNENSRSTDGIFRFDQTVSQGEIIRYMQYVDITAGPNDEACTLFAVQSPGTTNQNYAVCLEQVTGPDRISISKDVDDVDASGVIIGSTTVVYTTGWYEIEIDWQTNDTFAVSMSRNGTLIASTSATDGTYTSGGIGFTYWFQHGGWDSYTSRARVDNEPTVVFGAEQADGGATWASALDTQVSGFNVGEVARLRVAVENTGLSSSKSFLLEYAEQGVAPTCGAVTNASFATVPSNASCLTSPVCMATSTSVSDNDPTTDLLLETEGTFTTGRFVEDSSSITSSITLNQDQYTELEYAVAITSYADDESLCFRVTNNGPELDTYLQVARLGLRFDPTFGPVTLNNGQPITLTPGATTTIYATGTVTDLNGYTDLFRATSTIYRSGVGPSCTPNNNNCYLTNTNSATCSFTNCSGNTCTLSCAADIYYHADATSGGTYDGEEWLAYLEVSDVGGGYDFNSASGVELLALRALDVENSINYGSLEVSADTGSYNASTTVQNLGNTAIDVEISGTNLTDGQSSTIPAAQQIFATSTFTYSTCVYCQTLSTSTASFEVDINKPTVSSPLVSDVIYWGIEIPTGAASKPHSGNNTFTAISD
jgi:hypothetical protein